MSVEDRLEPDESVLASHHAGDRRWVLTERRLLRGERTVPLGSVRGVERVTLGRDLRYLYAGLASLTLAVLVPTLAVGAGIAFASVVPVGAVLAVGCPAGMVLWFRSTTVAFDVDVDDEGETVWRLPDEDGAAAFAEQVRERC
jgi:hypothetical protein